MSGSRATSSARIEAGLFFVAARAAALGARVAALRFETALLRGTSGLGGTPRLVALERGDEEVEDSFDGEGAVQDLAPRLLHLDEEDFAFDETPGQPRPEEEPVLVAEFGQGGEGQTREDLGVDLVDVFWLPHLVNQSSA